MCGIAGIVLQPNIACLDLRERLEVMCDVMVHRGPDDVGLYVAPDGRTGLGNRRLAIRDLSAAGHMPMLDITGGLAISYNGEIYNADLLRTELEDQGCRFRSTSDTEVILQGYAVWGTAVVGRLRGMFAFGLLDRRAGGAGMLLLARDPMGVKPLYVAWTGAALVFASELKAVLASGLVSREISPAGLTGYLMLGSVPNPLTIYGAIAALEPATYIILELDRPAERRTVTYWQLPTDTEEPAGYRDAVDRVWEHLVDAVRVRLVSDVPLGAFLSGGLDSSAVVALMRAATDGPIRTCSMVFAEAAYSEAPYARAMAESVGAEHFERVVTAEDLVAEFDAILAALDQPSVDGVNTYFVSQTARQAGLTVALSGIGGDEIFGGYPNTFVQAPQVRRAVALAQAVPGGVTATRTVLGWLPDHRRWTGVADALARPVSPASAYLARRGLFAPSEVKALLHPDLWEEGSRAFDPVTHIAARADGESRATPATRSPVQDMAWTSRAELRTYTHHQLLRDTDAMSMAHSLEVREPLLDAPLVAAVLRLPAAYKRRGQGPKPLLAAALGDRLPPAVRELRDKQGFTLPFAPWLRGPLAAHVHVALEQVAQSGWLRSGAGQAVARDFQAGRVHWTRLWALVALSCVLQQPGPGASAKLASSERGVCLD